MNPSEAKKITAKQLHDWYLEATQKLNPDNYNPKAQKPYEELNTQQQFIDQYIADKINAIKHLDLEELDEEVIVNMLITTPGSNDVGKPEWEWRFAKRLCSHFGVPQQAESLVEKRAEPGEPVAGFLDPLGFGSEHLPQVEFDLEHLVLRDVGLGTQPNRAHEVVRVQAVGREHQGRDFSLDGNLEQVEPAHSHDIEDGGIIVMTLDQG